MDNNKYEIFKANMAHLFSLAHQIYETNELSELFKADMPGLNLSTQRVARS